MRDLCDNAVHLLVCLSPVFFLMPFGVWKAGASCIVSNILVHNSTKCSMITNTMMMLITTTVALYFYNAMLLSVDFEGLNNQKLPKQARP